MFSYLKFSPATPYWPFPVVADEHALAIRSESINWLPRPRSPDSFEPLHSRQTHGDQVICDVLSSDDLYNILGIPRSSAIDGLMLRRAYLLRSKSCHPDKCPENPDATRAFQRVSVAYGVLSQPSLKRMYDTRPSSDQFDFLHSHPCGYADETLRGVLLNIINDYLDGNLEMIRTFLQAISDLNPSLKLSNDGINSILSGLENIRGRILTCRACILALHSEFVRVLELQYAFRQLPYLDITGRFRLTIQLTRITLSLPVTLERAIQDAQGGMYPGGARSATDERGRRSDKAALLPRHVVLLIKGIDVILDKMERILG